MHWDVFLAHVMQINMVASYSLDKLTNMVSGDHDTAKRSNRIHYYGIHDIGVVGIICPVS